MHLQLKYLESLKYKFYKNSFIYNKKGSNATLYPLASLSELTYCTAYSFVRIKFK